MRMYDGVKREKQNHRTSCDEKYVLQAVATCWVAAAWFSERLDGAWAAASPLRSATYIKHAGANLIATRLPGHYPGRCCSQPGNRLV